jgi:hypothetical protein
MKRIIIPLLFLPFILAFVKQKPGQPAKSKAYQVKIRITQTSNYCGGPPPSHEMIQELNTPKAYANQTFYLRPGNKNSLNYKELIKVKTDSTGTIRTKLKSGNYVLLFASQVNKPDTSIFKSNNNYEFSGIECLNTWWSKGWQVITVGAKNANLSFNLHFPCFTDPINGPCMEYRGPYPP